MSSEEEVPSGPQRAHKASRPTAAINVDQPATPTTRLNEMTRERIDSLDSERMRLLELTSRLQQKVDSLAPDNARLIEALGNAEANGFVSTILIGVGGGVISYATFTGKVSHTIANMGVGLLLAGILVMLTPQLRRWFRDYRASW